MRLHRRCKLAIGILLLSIGTQALAQFPWGTDEILIGTTNGSRSADDVVGDLIDRDVVYAVQTGSTSQQAIMRFTLTRDMNDDITGGSNDYIAISTLEHNNLGLKSLDLYDTDTVFYTMEEGDAVDTDGQIGVAQSIAAEPLTHSVAADLTNVRSGGAAPYDPEGIAIDQVNNFLYVMTDDGPNTDVAQYQITPGTPPTLSLNWVTTIETGGSNGNDGIVLSDGRVAAVSGTSSVNIFAVSQDGSTVSNLLGGATSGAGRDTPQDLLEFDGFLYLAWESGIIDAFDLGNLSTTPAASLDLDGLLTGTASIGGLGLTFDGHLLVSTRAAGGSTGEIYAFDNPNPVPVELQSFEVE